MYILKVEGTCHFGPLIAFWGEKKEVGNANVTHDLNLIPISIFAEPIPFNDYNNVTLIWYNYFNKILIYFNLLNVKSF